MMIFFPIACFVLCFSGCLKAGSFLFSSVGRKILVAVTGVAMVAFVIIHMLGNLQMFLGAEAINSYAAFLKSMPLVLWGSRIGLLAVFVTHFTVALWLTIENKRARPVAYEYQNTVQASISSRTMWLSGSVMFFYVIGHLLHFTVGVFYPELHALRDAQGRPDVYLMVIRSFQIQWVSFAYIFAMLCLWPHLSHGISSMFQSIGARTPRTKKFTDCLGPVLSAIIVLGFISIPAAVLLGFE